MPTGFSPEWEQVYQSGKGINRYPSSDLIGLVYNYAHANQGYLKFLEIGCGLGSNAAPIMEMSGQVTEWVGVEGSETACQTARNRTARPVYCMDFTQGLPNIGPVDCILDRSAMTHNDTVSILSGLALCYAQLRHGGKYIGVDWFGFDNDDLCYGEFIDDCTIITNENSSFGNKGKVHLSDIPHLRRLFKKVGFKVERITAKHYQDHDFTTLPAKRREYFDIVAVKV